MKKLGLTALLLLISVNALADDPTIFQRIVPFRKTVAAAGTSEAISSVSIPIKGCVVCSEDSNTGTVSIGSSIVVATEATRTGIYLLTADCAFIPVNDLTNIYVNSTISGDGITGVYYQ